MVHMCSRLTTFSVAESHYLARGARSPLDICGDLDLAVQLDLRYHFSGMLCAAYWIDLCKSREYGHDRLVGAIEHVLPAITEIIHDRIAPGCQLDIVSLGPGDGQVDIRILSELRRRLDVASYRCVDHSLEMLEYVLQRLERSGAVDDLPVTAVCGDFSSLRGFEVLGDHVSLLLLTGYTMGNNNEARLLGDIAEWMRPGDLLLIDGRLQGGGWSGNAPAKEQVDPLVRCYDNEASNRFAFGPVETVTTASFRDVLFHYRIERYVTTVPGALNIVTSCKGLETRMRLTGAIVTREQLDLGSTTIYDFEALRDWLETSPLSLLFACRDDCTGLFVLAKPQT
jgi:SAM-dependent methyltransferase